MNAVGLFGYHLLPIMPILCIADIETADTNYVRV